MTVDIVVKNCKLVSTERLSKAKIAVKGDKIVAITNDEDCLKVRRLLMPAEMWLSRSY